MSVATLEGSILPERFPANRAMCAVADRGLRHPLDEPCPDIGYNVTAASRSLWYSNGPEVFHVESIMQDPNVWELISEWEDKGRAKWLAKGRAEGRVVEARALLHRSSRPVRSW